jgi:hypothetical protein
MPLVQYDPLENLTYTNAIIDGLKGQSGLRRNDWLVAFYCDLFGTTAPGFLSLSLPNKKTYIRIHTPQLDSKLKVCEF